MKKYRVILLLLLLFVVISCSNQNVDTDNHSIDHLENTLSDQEKTLTFSDYQSLVEKVEQELELPNYQLKASTFGYSIVMIDEELSFGKREYVTLDGTQGLPINATQESLLFLHEQEDSLITITLAYTDNYIGNDILFYQSVEGFEAIKDELTDHLDLLSISYKNIIISILQTKSDETVDIENTINAGKSLVHFLNNL